MQGESHETKGLTGTPAGVPGPGLSLLAVSLLWFGLNGLGHVPLFKQATGQTAAAIAAAVLFGYALIRRRWLYRWLSSSAFAVALLIVLTLATAVGTFVLQGLPYGEFLRRYGRLGAAFHANDIFHSFPFREFLVILSGSLVLTTIRRRAWRMTEWGFLLAHTGVVVVLVGGLIATVSGGKGRIDLHADEATDSVKRQDIVDRGDGQQTRFVLHLAAHVERKGLELSYTHEIPGRKKKDPHGRGPEGITYAVRDDGQGGLVGDVGTGTNKVDYETGEVDVTFRVPPAAGVEIFASYEAKLGFSFRLDQFEIERHKEEYRFYVYRREGNDAKHDHEQEDEEERPRWTMAVSRSIADAKKEWTEIQPGRRFRLREVYPDFEYRRELREDPAGGPVAEMRLGQRDGRGIIVRLLEGDPERDFLVLNGAVVRLVRDVPAERPTGPVEAHTIEFRKDASAPSETIQVVPGGTYKVGGGEYELKVLGFYPDFWLNDRMPASRTPLPKNPALRVSVKKEGAAGMPQLQYLFGKKEHAQMHPDSGSGPKLTYQYTQGIPQREVIVVGGTREVFDYRQGRLVDRRPLKVDSEEPFVSELDLTCLKFLPAGREEGIARTRSQEWRNPYAEIEQDPPEGKERWAYLKAGERIEFPPDKFFVFDLKHDETVKTYRSHVSIIRKKHVVRQQTIEVNSPLSFGGYRFYQSNFKEEDPTYSGFLVTKDPGLETAYVGFGMLAVGVIFMLYVRPRLLRRRKEPAQEGQAQ